jgi:hypothetical protein
VRRPFPFASTGIHEVSLILLVGLDQVQLELLEEGEKVGLVGRGVEVLEAVVFVRVRLVLGRIDEELVHRLGEGGGVVARVEGQLLEEGFAVWGQVALLGREREGELRGLLEDDQPLEGVCLIGGLAALGVCGRGADERRGQHDGTGSREAAADECASRDGAHSEPSSSEAGAPKTNASGATSSPSSERSAASAAASSVTKRWTAWR